MAAAGRVPQNAASRVPPGVVLTAPLSDVFAGDVVLREPSPVVNAYV